VSTAQTIVRTSAAGVEHRMTPIEATVDVDGLPIVIWVHELVGQRPGPTLGVVGTQHGDEWLTVPAVHRAIETLQGEEFAGRVILIPVANPVAFLAGHRLTQVEADEPDMNRVWPGRFTWLTDMMAKALRPTMESCSALIDLHFGQWGVLMANTWWAEDLDDPELVARGRDMSIAFGTSVQRRLGLKHPGSGTLAAWASSELKIPVISGGIGGPGFGEELEAGWIQDNVTGIKNVMTTLGMREGMDLPEQLLHFSKTIRVHPSVGGLLIPEPGVSTVLPRVEAGQLLGRVVNAQTLEVQETLVAPSGGWLYWSARSYPVRPGCFAFGLAEEQTASWIPVDAK
jgi:predicted deacylase